MATPPPADSADGCATAPVAVDGRSGYCKDTKTFRSLRPPVLLPPTDGPLSFTAFAFSLLPSPLPAHPALLDAATGEAVSFPAFRSQVRSLAGALRSRVGLRGGDVAFVLAPARLDVPVLYFALLSFGAVVSPANPALTAAEVGHLVALSGASVAFAVSSTAAKLPAGLPTVLLDSDHFHSFLRNDDDLGEVQNLEPAVVRQSETAAIQYSSGTTGRVKAVALSHRSFTAMAAGSHALAHKPRHGRDRRMLLGAPMFHSLGFYYSLKGVALGETTVLVTDTVARRGLKGVVEAAERWAVSEMTASPPVVVGMAKERYGLEALERVVCGGAPLSTTAAEMFRSRFPNVDLCMVSFGHVAVFNLLFCFMSYLWCSISFVAFC
jgi:acyl-CoA synthetase (AMP-forming)/AMP-acid ligase II